MDPASSLPDYASLEKLAASLWQQDNAYHGAAIMVGAGFSRSAASTGDPTNKLPLWNDFSKILAGELGSNSSDPLRLAEEYYAYFGKQALHDLIKKVVNDGAWAAGEMHKSLLELPWSEVLTTNWDTLLERAALDVHQPVYSIVSKQADLSSARSPRIVKLHGTINVTEELIFTQEDYRRYPQNQAAFVNFARQVFIENELCLLGFSGEDPNFLQWSGWVRDHLATHSRRIYLVGALGLNSAKRKYLESINVAPIELDSLVSDYDNHDTKHVEAIRIFIQALHNLKPKQAWDWMPTKLHRTHISTEELNRTSQNHSHAARLLEQHIPTIEADRKSYPEWLVCPNVLRSALQTQISDPYPTVKALAEMEADSRAKLLYEIAWRHKVTHQAIPIWLSTELLLVCDPAKPCSLSKKQQLEIALFIFKNAYWFDDNDHRQIENATALILDREKKHWTEIGNEVEYHRAIMTRDKFDYPSMEAVVDKINPSNPVWKLRKAALFAELGKHKIGEELVAEAYRELLSQYRKDRNSIFIYSRLAWAHWLIRGIEAFTPGREFKAFPAKYKDSKCDPWDHIEHINDRASKELERQKKQQAIEPSFEPGRYTDNANSVTIGNQPHPILLLEGISNSVGMPLRWKGVSFLVESAEKIAAIDGIDGAHRFSLAIRSASSDKSEVIKNIFSRTQVARLTKDEVNSLIDSCTAAINYWIESWTSGSRESGNYPISRLRVFVEVLARVSVRATPEQAKNLFHLAIGMGKRPGIQHSWLFDALDHLLKFSLKSIPEEQHYELVSEALSFPLKAEVGLHSSPEWPNPVIEFPGSRQEDASLDRRIDEIIDSISPTDSASSSALLRLLPLIENKFLTEQEINKISMKVWGESPDYTNLPNTNLFPHVFRAIPSQDPIAVRNLIRSHLFDKKDSNLFSRNTLMNMTYAAQSDSFKELPSESQAIEYLERLSSWRRKPNENDVLGFFRQEDELTGELIGSTLSRSIAPSLPLAALTEENFQKIHNFYLEVESPETIIAFVYFAVADDVFVERVARLIRNGLNAEKSNIQAYSSYALLIWRKLKESPVIDRLILRLVYLVGANRTVGLQALLWTLEEMHKNDYLSAEGIESLTEIIPAIFDNLDYAKISPSSRESVSASLTRAACIRLARNILNKGSAMTSDLHRVLAEAKEDPLPEVRFA